MSHITKLAVIETTNTIWDYDPSEPDNRVLGDGLDVIATIWTLAIKIQSSGQRIQKFNSIQMECGFTTPLKITLHNNTRWGSAFGMLNRAYMLQAAINLFISSADQLYGPITTLHHDGRVSKKIPWTAFALSDSDWTRVLDAKMILADSNRVLHQFSADKHPSLYRALPALEDLQSAWESKIEDSQFDIYHDAIRDGLAKLGKYYCRFDEKPAYILALVLHPYFKLHYIKLAWGGAEEQAAKKAAGNRHAKNWQEEALQVVENAMSEYWNTRPQPSPTPHLTLPDPDSSRQDSFLSEFDRHRLTLVSQGGANEGWQLELRRYLQDMPAEVTRDTDIVGWWSNYAKVYPTLARIALDVLPSQASSVPCERVFSSSKLTATDRRARLKAEVFEELQVLKAVWRATTIDLARHNSEEVEEVLDEYETVGRGGL
ncbi:hypothetical protein D9615_003755 [Tricholomella constricta]|uniref:HAT C-terminal dimerisation domain-containing protein n=1 Tax=Tricholomella constricta TaxID=117010 RepID=A0A8H5HIT2_9AGAR|nr:hypothetical protein D9615_003755 [Tricholomella constricta]